jgi:predicted PurR-regulated permease PerM
MAERQFDLTRDTLAVVFLFALIAASIWILLPFLGAVVWATMIVVATWPFMLRPQGWLLGNLWLAVTSAERAGRRQFAYIYPIQYISR